MRNVSFWAWVVEVGRFGRKICEGIVGNRKTPSPLAPRLSVLIRVIRD